MLGPNRGRPWFLFWFLFCFRYEDEKPASAKKAPPSFKAGLLMCVLSGIFSPMLNVAVNFNTISKRAKFYGADGTGDLGLRFGTWNWNWNWNPALSVPSPDASIAPAGLRCSVRLS